VKLSKNETHLDIFKRFYFQFKNILFPNCSRGYLDIPVAKNKVKTAVIPAEAGNHCAAGSTNYANNRSSPTRG